jgi:hypothetical protein
MLMCAERERLAIDLAAAFDTLQYGLQAAQ